MQVEHVVLGEPLGAGRADVVLLQNLEHGRTGDARDQRDIDRAERDRRQDQVLEPGPDPLGDRRVALHRHPVELEREDVGEQVADHEDRDREAEDRETDNGAVDPGSGLPGCDHAERHGDHHREDQRQHHQRQGRLDPQGDQLRNRQRGEDRGAEIALQHPEEPFAEADQIGAVEPEALADALDIGGRGLVAGDDGRRVARRDIEEREDEQRHESHDGDRRDDTSDDKSEHRDLDVRLSDAGLSGPEDPDSPITVLSGRCGGVRHQALDTPQKTGNGPLVTPCTFFRQAW